MALYQRITTDFADIDGREYTIRIYKEASSAPQIAELVSQSPGFTHEYYSDNEELWSFIKYGKLTTYLMIESASHKALIDELLTGIEGEWFIKVTYADSGEVTYFQGVILIDQATYPNQPYPYPVSITASDGLSLLQNKRIPNTGLFFDSPWNATLYNILNQFQFGDFGAFSFNTSFRFWNSRFLGYDNSDLNRDPLVYLFNAMQDLFYTDKRGGREFFTYGEVLNEICGFLHCNLVYSYGTYWLINIHERTETTLYLSKYADDFAYSKTADNTYASAGFSNEAAYDHVYSLASNGDKPEYGGMFTQKPASKLIRETNSAEGAFKKGVLTENSLHVWRPIDLGTSGSLNVPETQLGRLAEVRDGIENIRIKGKMAWYAKQLEPVASNIYEDLNNRTIYWKLRFFFVQKNTTADNFTYGSEDVYRGSDETWGTGSDYYTELSLGNVSGTTTADNILFGNRTLTAALTTDNITSVSQNGTTLSSLEGEEGWIRILDNNTVWKYLHYSDYVNATGTFTIDTTTGDEDFNSVNASIGNTLQVIQEKETFYQASFDIKANNFTNTNNLFLNAVVIGEDYQGNVIAYPLNEYEYGTAPGSQEFDTYEYSAEVQISANQDVTNITNFEFITENTNNSNNSYEIILPENKILEKEVGFYGSDSNWLKVFTPDNTTGDVTFSNRYPAGANWGTGIAGSQNSRLRRLNHGRLLAMTAEPYLMLETALRSYVGMHQQITYDSKDWIISSGVFSANEKLWDMVLLEVKTNSVVDDNTSNQGVRQLPPNNGDGIFNAGRRTADVGIFDFLALTDGETTGTVTTIQIRDGKGINLIDNATVRIYNPQTGKHESLVLDGTWNGEADITVDSIALDNTYPDGCLIQITGSDVIKYLNLLTA